MGRKKSSEGSANDFLGSDFLAAMEDRDHALREKYRRWLCLPRKERQSLFCYGVLAGFLSSWLAFWFLPWLVTLMFFMVVAVALRKWYAHFRLLRQLEESA